jgi:hypothetical protein
MGGRERQYLAVSRELSENKEMRFLRMECLQLDSDAAVTVEAALIHFILHLI